MKTDQNDSPTPEPTALDIAFYAINYASGRIITQEEAKAATLAIKNLDAAAQLLIKWHIKPTNADPLSSAKEAIRSARFHL